MPFSKARLKKAIMFLFKKCALYFLFQNLVYSKYNGIKEILRVGILKAFENLFNFVSVCSLNADTVDECVATYM